jgi:hypothetical protein
LWARSLIVVAAIASVTAIDRAAPLLIVTLFVLVVPFEKLFPRHHQRLRRPGLGTDIAYVQALLARGLTNADIAAALDVGEATAKTHVSHVLTKLGARPSPSGHLRVRGWIRPQQPGDERQVR